MTRVVLCAALACVCGSHALAQEAPAFRPARVTFAGGAILAGGYPVGDVTATLRRNTTGDAMPTALLRAESRIARATGFEARVNVALSRAFAVEASGSYALPQLQVDITGDAEAQGVASASESISQYTLDVSAIVQLARVRLGPRMRPYVIGGAGYLRQLHEGHFLVETGRTAHVGGGIQYWLRGAASDRRPLGLRAEGRYVRRMGGIDFQDRGRGYMAVSLLAFAGL